LRDEAVWLVFVIGTASVKGYQHPQPGCGFTVLAGAVNAVSAAEAVDDPYYIVGHSRLNAVNVEGDKVASRGGVRGSAEAFESTAHKAAHVLQLVLFGFRQGKVFGEGLGASVGGAELLAKLRPHYLLPYPAYGPSAVSDGYI